MAGPSVEGYDGPMGADGTRPEVQAAAVEAAEAQGAPAAAAPDLLAAVLDASPDAVVLVDAALRVVGWNRGATEVFGLTAGEAAGRPALDLLAPAHLRATAAPRLAEFVARPGVVGECRRVEVPLQRRDGREFVARVTLGVHETAAGRGLACFVQDLTEVRRAEAARRDGERRLRQIIDLVPHFIFAKDAEGRFVLVNEAVAKAYGTTVEALLGRRDADFNANPQEVDHFRDDDLAVLREGKPKRVAEEVLTDATGRTRVLETMKIPFAVGEAGTPTVLGVSTDLTERKRVEADLLHAQRMEGIGRLAGGVAHDFNNVLTAILGSVQLLEARLASDPTGRREVETIRTAAERAASLTRQLLTFARRDHARPQPVDLAALTLDLERMLRRVLGSPVELVADVDASAGAVEVDPGQMEQVIVNLVVNARDAMPRGGRLTVRTRAVPEGACPVAAVGHAGDGPWVELSVADTGEGIPPAVLPRIFEPFFSTKHAAVGTGLGLSICYGIVKRSGGHIWAETAPGRGTTFRVLLPRSAKAPAPRPPSGDAVAPPGRETVLVMDDEDAVRATMVRTLADLGYRVLAAGGGEDGVELARTHPGRIDLVLADVVMPGTSGPAAVERILATRPGTRVVYVSGYYDPERLQELGSGSAALLGKPFTPAALARTVRTTLDRAAPC